MADSFTIDEAQIVASFLETLFFGIFLVTFGLCLQTLLRENDEWRSLSSIRWSMLAVAVAMAIFATLDVMLGFAHNLDAFVYYKGPGGPIEKFSQISDWINIMKTVNVTVQTTIGDGMLIYRCWVVFNRKFTPIFFPFLLWLGDIAVQGYIIYLEGTLRTQTLISASKLDPAITAFWVLTIVLNLYTTPLIVYRIWSIDKASSGAVFVGSSRRKRPSRLRWVMKIIVESGAMYTAIAIITFATYVGDSNAVYGVSDVEVQVVGIAFNLIIIRAAKYPVGTTYAGTTTQSRTFELGYRRKKSEQTLPIRITQETETSDYPKTVTSHSSIPDDPEAPKIPVNEP